MPNITIYITKEMSKALKKRKDINRSEVCGKALAEALKEEPK